MAEQKQKDFVPHGGEGHANLLGLRKAEKGETPEFNGWTLVDPTQWGPNANPGYIQAQLVQRVGELKSAPEVPVGAVPMWKP